MDHYPNSYRGCKKPWRHKTPQPKQKNTAHRNIEEKPRPYTRNIGSRHHTHRNVPNAVDKNDRCPAYQKPSPDLRLPSCPRSQAQYARTDKVDANELRQRQPDTSSGSHPLHEAMPPEGFFSHVGHVRCGQKPSPHSHQFIPVLGIRMTHLFVHHGRCRPRVKRPDRASRPSPRRARTR